MFFSRRKQKITLEKDPKLAINGPKQPAALASPNPVAANSNFFIPASPATPTKGLQEILENDNVWINQTITTISKDDRAFFYHLIILNSSDINSIIFIIII